MRKKQNCSKTIFWGTRKFMRMLKNNVRTSGSVWCVLGTVHKIFASLKILVDSLTLRFAWILRKSDMKFRIFCILLRTLKDSFSMTRRSWKKIKYMGIIYCSRKRDFRGLLLSSSKNRLRYDGLKLEEYEANRLARP